MADFQDEFIVSKEGIDVLTNNMFCFLFHFMGWAISNEHIEIEAELDASVLEFQREMDPKFMTNPPAQILSEFADFIEAKDRTKIKET